MAIRNGAKPGMGGDDVRDLEAGERVLVRLDERGIGTGLTTIFALPVLAGIGGFWLVRDAMGLLLGIAFGALAAILIGRLRERDRAVLVDVRRSP